MDQRYLKLDSEYIYQLRRELKSYDDFFNSVLRNIRSYKLLRKKETALKNKIKIEMTSLKTKLNSAELTLPREERESLRQIASPIHNKVMAQNIINTIPSKSEVIEHHPKSYPRIANAKTKREFISDENKTTSHKSSIDRDLEEIRNKLKRFEN